MAVESWRIHVEGIVQGVGFRPFVFRLAQELGLHGWVNNAADGVHILARGTDAQLEEFLRELRGRRPAAAAITDISWQETDEPCENGFFIAASQVQPGRRTLVSPDLATCPECLAELLDATDRRFHYPFINCTNCGPRFTIIRNLPYDRARTTMAAFAMCEPCEHEYHDPANRRFHAQPDACFACGPHLELRIPETAEQLSGTTQAESDAVLRRSVELLGQGSILAIKGLGGYHLACDATNEEAVARLRERKRRPRKPLAVMYASLEAVRARFAVNSGEAALLTSPAAPIVLLRGSTSAGRPAPCGHRRPLAYAVCCGLAETGVMLPATPLHHLLLKAMDTPLVMTSGNVSEEPIIGDDALAQELLGGIADAFLLHDRPIVSRYDDSVVRVLASPCLDRAGTVAPSPSPSARTSVRPSCHPLTLTTQFVRRARGYAPAPLAVPVATAPGEVLLATGPEQKSSFCLASGTDAFVSQHLGNLDNADSFATYLDTIQLYEELFALQPTALVADLHPEYLSTRWAQEQSAERGIPLLQVQHHHAHIAAVIAENMREAGTGGTKGGRGNGPTNSSGSVAPSPCPSSLAPPFPVLSSEQEVIGIALDGTGYGTDGTIWGGELLVASLQDASRFAHLECFPLPGGSQAIRHPLRAACALLLYQGLAEHPAARGVRERLGEASFGLIKQMLEKGVNAPLTSSAGRLFDVVSALLGICDEASYEGEPAILLEAAMSGGGGASLAASCAPSSDTFFGASPAPPLATPYIMSTRSIIRDILDGIEAGVSVAALSRQFHEAFMGICVDAAVLAREKTGLELVALSGGVFNNRFLATHMPVLLQQAGFVVLTHLQLPPNDGCISYGQAAVACARLSQNFPRPKAGTLTVCV
ncbi:MAG: carbamoyltransferase HypF [Coriobacteriales bacterium]|jgi:hydrogenase maturation protein HypF|nr:carbamoyltransferase HypF [Coriobacteriales bacterium]